MSADASISADLPVPHRCPWLIQYFLVSPLRRWLEPAGELLDPHVRPGMTVLEPGCGFGYFSLPLARLVGSSGNVLCVDVEAGAIERLNRRAQRAGLQDQISARTCDVGNMGLDAYRGKVDLVVLVHTLHEFDDLPGFFDQIRGLLAADGRIWVVERFGHVQPDQFQAMLTCAAQHGLEVIERSELRGGRVGALLGLA